MKLGKRIATGTARDEAQIAPAATQLDTAVPVQAPVTQPRHELPALVGDTELVPVSAAARRP